jgi:glutamate/aspartate transport system permease protein
MGPLDFSKVWAAAPYLLSGLQFTLMLTAVTLLVGMILGIILATIQQLQVPVLSQVVRAYVALIRSVPLILVLFWFFFLVPIALGHLLASGRPIPIGASSTAFVTFSLFEAAYYSESCVWASVPWARGSSRRPKRLRYRPFGHTGT